MPELMVTQAFPQMLIVTYDEELAAHLLLQDTTSEIALGSKR